MCLKHCLPSVLPSIHYAAWFPPRLSKANGNLRTLTQLPAVLSAHGLPHIPAVFSSVKWEGGELLPRVLLRDKGCICRAVGEAGLDLGRWRQLPSHLIGLLHTEAARLQGTLKPSRPRGLQGSWGLQAFWPSQPQPRHKAACCPRPPGRARLTMSSSPHHWLPIANQTMIPVHFTLGNRWVYWLYLLVLFTEQG